MAGSLYHISFCSTRLKQQVFLKVGLQLPRFPGIQVDTPPCGGLVTSSPKIVVPPHLAFSRTWPVKVPISRTFIYQRWYCPWTAAAPLLLGAPFFQKLYQGKIAKYQCLVYLRELGHGSVMFSCLIQRSFLRSYTPMLGTVIFRCVLTSQMEEVRLVWRGKLYHPAKWLLWN